MQDFISTKGLEQANPQRQTHDQQLSGAGGREGSGGWGVTGSGAGLGVTLSPLPRMHFPLRHLTASLCLGTVAGTSVLCLGSVLNNDIVNKKHKDTRHGGPKETQERTLADSVTAEKSRQSECQVTRRMWPRRMQKRRLWGEAKRCDSGTIRIHCLLTTALERTR